MPQPTTTIMLLCIHRKISWSQELDVKIDAINQIKRFLYHIKEENYSYPMIVETSNLLKLLQNYKEIELIYTGKPII